MSHHFGVITVNFEHIRLIHLELLQLTLKMCRSINSSPLQPSDAFQISTSHMIYSVNRFQTGSYMKCNTWLK